MKYSCLAIKNTITNSLVQKKTDELWLFTDSEETIVDMIIIHFNNTGKDLQGNKGKFEKVILDLVERTSDISLKPNDLSKLSETIYEELFSDSPCKNCSNNPKNGGSGICNCILGLPKITC